MNIIISENQYKVLLNEKFNIELKSIANFYQKFVNKIVRDVANQYKINTRMALVYGAGIGPLMLSVEEYLNDEFTGLEPWQISFLVLSAFSIVFFSSKDYFKLKKDLEQQGLTDKLDKAVKKTEQLKDKFADMLNILGITIYSVKDILSYTFLLPILNIMVDIITNFGINSHQFSIFVESVLTSGLITTSGVLVRNVLQTVAEKISKKSSNEMGDENI